MRFCLLCCAARSEALDFPGGVPASEMTLAMTGVSSPVPNNVTAMITDHNILTNKSGSADQRNITWNGNKNTHLWRPHPAWPLYPSRTAADTSGHRSVWLLPAWRDSASVSLYGRRCHTLQPERKQWVNAESRQSITLVILITTSRRLAYMAEEHGVFGPALLRAELLGRASVLSRHQLLGHRVAVDAGVTVFPPVFSQVMSEEEFTAWEEGEESVNPPWCHSVVSGLLCWSLKFGITAVTIFVFVFLTQN